MRISDWSSDVCSSDLRCHLSTSRSPAAAPIAGSCASRSATGGAEATAAAVAVELIERRPLHPGHGLDHQLSDAISALDLEALPRVEVHEHDLELVAIPRVDQQIGRAHV